LELEITENVLVDDLAPTIAVMEALNILGVSLAIDDFGTGYSSLNYLHRFPLSKLKIDQSFVQSIGEPGGKHAIVEAIIAMARALDLEVIAEGIENRAHIAFLMKHGCVYGQGFYFSRPLPAKDFEQFMLQDRINKASPQNQQQLP
jgi:EAL domain-containing protein (putative c-di-GMP-specific phosphodiesterase class I)